MDKLRAIEYFNQAAASGSFAAAARHFGVSTPAVTQLVSALERSLGISLFHRTRQGLTLTADGAQYYETSRNVAADLHDIEQRLGPRDAKPRGRLTVGMRDSLGHTCVMPRIARFLDRFPDVELDLKPIRTFEDIDKENIDVALLPGWPAERDLIVRPLAQTRLVVCASPDYWLRTGTPQIPDDLRRHDCLVIRSTGGTQLDRWSFEKNGQRCSIEVRSRIFSDERIWLYDAACAGMGVIRVGDLTLVHHLSVGRLVPVLTDWEALESPTIFAAYSPRLRHSKLVRVFMDFLVEVFSELDSLRMPAPGSRIRQVPKPEWFGRTHGRHSNYMSRRGKSR